MDCKPSFLGSTFRRQTLQYVDVHTRDRTYIYSSEPPEILVPRASPGDCALRQETRSPTGVSTQEKLGKSPCVLGP